MWKCDECENVLMPQRDDGIFDANTMERGLSWFWWSNMIRRMWKCANAATRPVPQVRPLFRTKMGRRLL